MNAAGAFLRRDFLVAWSYRFSFIFEQLGMLLSLVTTRFIGDLISGNATEALRPYGGDYFSFALVGMAVQILIFPAVMSIRGAMREAQVLGTFEAMLATRAHPLSIVLSAGLYPILAASLRLMVTMLVIGALMGAHIHLANPLAIAGAFVLTMMIFVGMGLISAAFTIVMRQSEPFTLGLLSASGVISGILYPVAVLPHNLALLAPLSPLTHVLELFRGLLLTDAHVSLTGPLIGTSIFALLFPIGLFVMGRAIEYARERGTLAQY